MGRRAERACIHSVLSSVRSGQSQVLVLRGEAGIGKSALLRHIAGQANGCRLLVAAGVQADMELAFAGLHQILGALMGGIDRLPHPQRDAMRVAFGMLAAPPPDRFLLAGCGKTPTSVGLTLPVRRVGRIRYSYHGRVG